jgi:hypothetical protein
MAEASIATGGVLAWDKNGKVALDGWIGLLEWRNVRRQM